FLFTAPPPPHIYPLSLHDALPISPDYLAALGMLEAVVASTRTSTLCGQNPAGPSRHLRPRVARARQGFAAADCPVRHRELGAARDRKSTRLNSSHQIISYAVFCLK